MSGYVLIVPEKRGARWLVFYGRRRLFQEMDRMVAENKARMFADIHGIKLVIVDRYASTDDLVPKAV